MNFIHHVLNVEAESEEGRFMAIPKEIKLSTMPRFIFGHSMGGLITVNVLNV